MTRLVRAGNPGPMTLDGTNTWLVGSARVLVVDPGPDDEDHLRAVLAEVARDGGLLGGVLLTHRHHDHAEALGSPLLREAVAVAGAAVLAVDPALGEPPEPRRSPRPRTSRSAPSRCPGTPTTRSAWCSRGAARC